MSPDGGVQRWKTFSVNRQVPPGSHALHHHHLNGFPASAWALEGDGIRAIVIEFNEHLSCQGRRERIALDAYNPDGPTEPIDVPAYPSKQ
ncbi:MAG: hypothetical protein ABI142_03875 [Bryocella sp.]